MSTKLVRFEYETHIRWGVVQDDQVYALTNEFATTSELVRALPRLSLAAAIADQKPVPLDSVKLLAPITANQQFICQGANYRQHMLESGVDPDAKHFNMLFTKAPSCIVPADSDVIRPHRVRFLDYEVELGLVLRKDLDRPASVTAANLHEFVAAVVIVNDYSARDIQIPEMQFYKGKSFRTFGPVGPYLVLIDANNIHCLSNLNLSLAVNGQPRQTDSTRNMVHGPAETLTEVSQIHNLQAGDLIATGTPSGCALAIPSPGKQRIAALLPERLKWKLFLQAQAKRTQYLQPGDLVEASIKSPDGTLDLGTQRNHIRAEAEVEL